MYPYPASIFFFSISFGCMKRHCKSTVSPNYVCNWRCLHYKMNETNEKKKLNRLIKAVVWINDTLKVNLSCKFMYEIVDKNKRKQYVLSYIFTCQSIICIGCTFEATFLKTHYRIPYILFLSYFFFFLCRLKLWMRQPIKRIFGYRSTEFIDIRWNKYWKKKCVVFCMAFHVAVTLNSNIKISQKIYDSLFKWFSFDIRWFYHISNA